MAIRLEDEYPGQTVAATAAYPHGAAQNVTVPGDGQGTPWEKAIVNDIFGFLAALLAEGAITPSGTPDTATASQYLAGVYAAAMNAEYTPLEGPAISLSGFLDRQGLWAATRDEIVDANDYLVAQLKKDTIKLPPGATIAVGTQINLDADYVSLDGNGAILDAATLASGAILNVTAGDSPSDKRSPAVLRDMTLLGPGALRNGIILTSLGSSGDGPTALLMQRLTMQDLAVGEQYNTGKVPVIVEDCITHNCVTGVQVIGTNRTPIIRRGGRISQCDLAVQAASGGRVLDLTAIYFEENDKLFEITNSGIDLRGCHIFANDYSVIPITMSGPGSVLNIDGGTLELGGTPPATFSRWVDAGAGTMVRVVGTRMVNTNTASRAFASGDGIVVLRDLMVEDPGTEFYLAHQTRSALKDPGFEDAGITDDVFITESDVAITDRHSAGGTTLDKGVVSHAGSASLRYNKAGGSGVSSAFVLASMKVRPGDRVSGIFYWQPQTNLTTTSITFRVKWVRRGYNGSGVPELTVSETVETYNMPIEVGVSGWQSRPFGTLNNLNAPEWADEVVVEVYGTVFNGAAIGSIYFDDININVTG